MSYNNCIFSILPTMTYDWFEFINKLFQYTKGPATLNTIVNNLVEMTFARSNIYQVCAWGHWDWNEVATKVSKYRSIVDQTNFCILKSVFMRRRIRALHYSVQTRNISLIEVVLTGILLTMEKNNLYSFLLKKNTPCVVINSVSLYNL